MDLIERGDAGAYRHPWETARFKFVRRLIAKFATRPNPLVLDIGSGDGFFLESLHASMGSGEFVGVDIALSNDEVNQLNSKAPEGVRFCNHWKALDQLVHRPADVILLLDVIEHIPDDEAFLRELAKASFISKDTTLVVTVPAFWSLRTSHDEHLKHFRRYSLPQVRQVVSASGFEPIDGGYFFFSLLVPRVAEKVREIVLAPKREFGIGGWQKGLVMTKTIEAALLADAAIGSALSNAGIRLPGLSAYVICRRSS